MERGEEFGRVVAGERASLAGEIWLFLRVNKKWWLLPIALVFFLLGALMLLGGTAAAPFIYTLF